MHPWHKNTLRSTPTQGYFLQSGLTKVIPKNSSHSEPRLYSLSPNFFLLIMKIQFTLNLLCLVGFLCNSTYEWTTYYAWNMRAPRSYCFSPHMSNRHLWQLKKIKSWGLIWSNQLNSTANPAHSPQKLGQMGWIGTWHSCLAGSSKTAPKIFILAEIHCYLGVRIFHA